MSILITGRGGAVRIPVHAQPRASRSEVVGEHGGAIKVRLAAPPVEGAANDELIDLLARKLRVAPSAIRIIQGRSSRKKTVEVEGISPREVALRLGL